MRSGAVRELDEAHGTVMEIDDSTPEVLSTLMAKIKYIQDCMVLKGKVTSESFLEDNPIGTRVNDHGGNVVPRGNYTKG